jgi:hypothetical protein
MAWLVEESPNPLMQGSSRTPSASYAEPCLPTPEQFKDDSLGIINGKAWLKVAEGGELDAISANYKS